jgi:hypothetical protein
MRATTTTHAPPLALTTAAGLHDDRALTESTQESLDLAALGMVQRARLPPLPPGPGIDSAAFTNPIVFATR